eukprot:7920882-Alexandrium_andersonii.AAC.1
MDLPSLILCSRRVRTSAERALKPGASFAARSRGELLSQPPPSQGELQSQPWLWCVSTAATH